MRSLLQLIALATLSLSLGVAGAPAPEPAPESESGPALVKRADPQGCDVSNWQGSLNWATIKSQGVQFAYIKATEGTTFIDSYFNQNYVGATNNGIIRGAGAAQANYFLAHGGGWSGDGITLPGALDLEGSCAGLTAAQMVSWIHDFANTYHAATTSRCHPLHLPSVIYTTTSWWTSCTGNSAAFGSTSPLWIAHWAASIGTLPAGWSYTTFWQYADSGTYPGDQDLFNGDAAGLKRMALGS
ncbi:glycoside hydrolase family 25 protein [Lactarius vividus]|nr:glycoside hydrolase family 25 protein [Lactarius vividus]